MINPKLIRKIFFFFFLNPKNKESEVKLKGTSRMVTSNLFKLSISTQSKASDFAFE